MPTSWLSATAQALRESWQPTLAPVINATGVIIHTNLGRAPLSAEACAAVTGVAQGYSNLEYDLDSGERGSRHSHIERLVANLVGAEAAMVVNNNASAVLLALSAVAKGKEVIVSRGQAVEIGGGFRIPDVMRQSGASLVEVGTTNRTYLARLRGAITERTAALLQVHSSNFRVVGFTESVDLCLTCALWAAAAACPSSTILAPDRCSIRPPTAWPMSPWCRRASAAGAALTCFSGDKLLGGPQAGLIVGRADAHCAAEAPSAGSRRAYRQADAGGAASDPAALRARRGAQPIPVWMMISRPLEHRAAGAGLGSGDRAHWPGASSARCRCGESTVGGGSLPGETLPTRLVAIRPGGSAGKRCKSRPS